MTGSFDRAEGEGGIAWLMRITTFGRDTDVITARLSDLRAVLADIAAHAPASAAIGDAWTLSEVCDVCLVAEADGTRCGTCGRVRQ